MPRAPPRKFKLGRRRLANSRRKKREDDGAEGKRKRPEKDGSSAAPSAKPTDRAPPPEVEPRSAYQSLLHALPTSGRFSRIIKQRMREADGLDEEPVSSSDDDDDDDSGSEGETGGDGSGAADGEAAGDDAASEDADDSDDSEPGNEGVAAAAGIAAADATDSDAGESVDEAGASVSADPFTARYLPLPGSDAPAAAELAAAAKAASALALVPAFDLLPAAIGAGDSASALLLSAPPGWDASHLAAVSLKDQAHSTHGLPLPPPRDLVGDDKVKARVAAAWNATYGAETQAIAVKHERMRARLAARAAGAAAAPPPPAAGARAAQHPFTPLQHALWPALNAYADVYFACRSPLNARELRTLSTLHAANHVVKARELVVKHDARLREAAVAARAARIARAVDSAGAAGGDATGSVAGGAAAAAGRKRQRKGAAASATVAAAAAALAAADAEAGEAADGGAGHTGDSGAPPECRDQGFTRPRVLVLLPFRHAALQWVRSLLRLLPGRQVMNRNRFFAVRWRMGGNGWFFVTLTPPPRPHRSTRTRTAASAPRTRTTTRSWPPLRPPRPGQRSGAKVRGRLCAARCSRASRARRGR